jgi:hypothetical protein
VREGQEEGREPSIVLDAPSSELINVWERFSERLRQVEVVRGELDGRHEFQ